MIQSQSSQSSVAAALVRSNTFSPSPDRAGNLLDEVRFAAFGTCGTSLLLPKGRSRLSIVEDAVRLANSSRERPLVKPETLAQIAADARFSRRPSRDTPIKMLGAVPGAEFRSEESQRAILRSQDLSAPRIEDVFVAAVLFELATRNSFFGGNLAVRASDGLVFRGVEGLEIGCKELKEQLKGFIGAIGIAAQLKGA
jgi:hypothetical protein